MNRVDELRKYLFNILDLLLHTKKYQINVNMLNNDIKNFSLDKIPTKPTLEKWITGEELHQDIYSFRSRCKYNKDEMNNLINMNFFETFENVINFNNKKGILPNIEKVESIECLNCASMSSSDGNTAEFDIQLSITYRI